RDRGAAFAEGARDGAPDAVQVADRWHLLKNLGDAIEGYLERIRSHLPPDPACSDNSGPQTPPASETRTTDTTAPPPKVSRAEQERQRRRARRRERYEAVLALHRQGLSLRVVARRLDLSRQTVRKYVHAEAFPEISSRAKRPGLLDPFRGHLEQRWHDGCRRV